jgi:hypothetical protein
MDPISEYWREGGVDEVRYWVYVYQTGPQHGRVDLDTQRNPAPPEEVAELQQLAQAYGVRDVNLGGSWQIFERVPLDRLEELATRLAPIGQQICERPGVFPNAHTRIPRQ